MDLVFFRKFSVMKIHMTLLFFRNLDRVERIEKLEAILTDVTSMALGSRSSSSHNINGMAPVKVDAETQTISTGDISITKVYSPSKSLPKEGSQI